MNATQVTIPSENEIAEAEKRLIELKRLRDEAKKNILSSINLEDLAAVLSRAEASNLIKVLQSKFSGNHRKVRGSPVPPQLRQDLERALHEGTYTLSQLEKIFGLSISYISRIKKELGLSVSRSPVVAMKYEDHPMNHHKAS